MAGLKTQRNDGDVDAFLASIDDERKRDDARRVRSMMADVTGDDGAMWGDAPGSTDTRRCWSVSAHNGRSCLYLKRLDDVDTDVLRELVEASVRHIDATYPASPRRAR
jgi:hypothetical protein